MAKSKAKSRRRRRDSVYDDESVEVATTATTTCTTTATIATTTHVTPTYKEREWQKRHIKDQKEISWRIVHFPQEGKYIGHVNSQGERHGEGFLQGDRGMSYEGDWENGLMSGSGVKMFPSGDRYEGSHLAGQRSGWGYYLWNCGDKYTGMWERSVMHGRGCFVWACGDMYTGMWKNGVISGRGHKVCADGSSVKGSFRNGEPHGWCVQTMAAGDVFTGNLKAGRRHGYGQYKWINGEIYTGMWEDSRMQGEGELIVTPRKGRGSSSEDFVLHYRGEFKSDTRHGYGEGTFVSGKRYFGHWRDDQPHGWGTMVYQNGGVGEGEYFKGVLDASGVMIFRNHDHAQGHDGGVASHVEEVGIVAATNAASLAASSGFAEDSSFWLLSCMSPVTPPPLLQELVNQTFMLPPHAASCYDLTAESNNNGPYLDQTLPSQILLRDDLYRGAWKDNIPHGIGVMDYSSGNIFLGHFSRGMRHGEGVLFRKKNKSLRESYAEVADEDFDLNLGATHTSDLDNLTMYLSHGAFNYENRHTTGLSPDHVREDSGRVVDLRNYNFYLQLQECLQWSSSSCGELEGVLQVPASGIVSSTFPFHIIRGMWRADHLISLLP